MSLKTKGFTELSSFLRRFPKGAKAAAASAQINAAQAIMETAAARAPFEHGALEASAFVSDPKYGNKGVAVEYGFGGNGVDYVIRQHEDLDYNHPGLDSRTEDEGRAAAGQAKFLESAVTEHQGTIEREYQKALAHYARTGTMPPTASGPITRRGPE